MIPKTLAKQPKHEHTHADFLATKDCGGGVVAWLARAFAQEHREDWIQEFWADAQTVPWSQRCSNYEARSVEQRTKILSPLRCSILGCRGLENLHMKLTVNKRSYDVNTATPTIMAHSGFLCFSQFLSSRSLIVWKVVNVPPDSKNITFWLSKTIFLRLRYNILAAAFWGSFRSVRSKLTRRSAPDERCAQRLGTNCSAHACTSNVPRRGLEPLAPKIAIYQFTCSGLPRLFFPWSRLKKNIRLSCSTTPTSSSPHPHPTRLPSESSSGLTNEYRVAYRDNYIWYLWAHNLAHGTHDNITYLDL